MNDPEIVTENVIMKGNHHTTTKEEIGMINTTNIESTGGVTGLNRAVEATSRRGSTAGIGEDTEIHALGRVRSLRILSVLVVAWKRFRPRFLLWSTGQQGQKNTQHANNPNLIRCLRSPTNQLEVDQKGSALSPRKSRNIPQSIGSRFPVIT